MKKINYIIFTLILFLVLGSVSAKEITIHLFYSETCPHCAAEEEFLDEYLKENKNVKLEMYEVTTNDDNAKLLEDVKKTLNVPHNYIPYTVIGEMGLTGYNESRSLDIKHLVEKYENQNYVDIVEEVKKQGTSIDYDSLGINEEDKVDEDTVTIPFIGESAKSKVSLPLAAIIIGFIDGFNPCAMWILIFLISMLLSVKDKKRRIGLGIIFLISSGIVYMLFMGAWLSIILSTVQIKIIQKIIGLVAIIGAIWNLHSYFKTKAEDIGCEVTDENKRRKMMERVKKYVSEKSFILAAIGLIGLSFSVNLVEFACSAGWPVIFTELLAIHNLSGLSYFIYILIYIVFYMIDDIIVFIIAMLTLEVTGISNKYNKYSHLIGGILMLIIGLLMIFKPSILMLNF